MFLTYLKLKVMLFTLFVVAVPSIITIYTDLMVSKLISGADPFSVFINLFQYEWWKALLFLYFQSLVFTFLGSLFWNVGKVIFKNRDFFMM